MNSSIRLALALGLSLSAGITFLACGGGDDDPKSGEGPGTTPSTDPVKPGDQPAANVDGLQLAFNPMFSSVVPGRTVQLPVVVRGARPGQTIKGAKFTTDKPDLVDVQDTPEGAMLTMKAPGNAVITAELDGKKGSAPLTITSFTAEDYAEGEKRYSNGIKALVESADAGRARFARNAEGACTTCHGANAEFLDVQHTPQQIGGYSDEELITIITTGQKPMGAPRRTIVSIAGLWDELHQWQLTDAQKRGVVAYLRSITPATQGEVDYSFLRPDGGFGGGRRNDGGGGARPTDAGTPSPTPTPTEDAGASAVGDAG